MEGYENSCSNLQTPLAFEVLPDRALPSMLPLLSLSLPLLSRPLSDRSRLSATDENVVLACRDWNEGGRSSGGTVGGKA